MQTLATLERMPSRPLQLKKTPMLKWMPPLELQKLTMLKWMPSRALRLGAATMQQQRPPPLGRRPPPWYPRHRRFWEGDPGQDFESSESPQGVHKAQSWDEPSRSGRCQTRDKQQTKIHTTLWMFKSRHLVL